MAGLATRGLQRALAGHVGLASPVDASDFAVHMHSGMRYVFELDVSGAGSAMHLVIDAREVNSAGETTKELRPTTDAAELSQCQSEPRDSLIAP